jgi:hypothetical protein
MNTYVIIGWTTTGARIETTVKGFKASTAMVETYFADGMVSVQRIKCGR